MTEITIAYCQVEANHFVIVCIDDVYLLFCCLHAIFEYVQEFEKRVRKYFFFLFINVNDKTQNVDSSKKQRSFLRINLVYLVKHIFNCLLK